MEPEIRNGLDGRAALFVITTLSLIQSAHDGFVK
jgi:hypothetical protein